MQITVDILEEAVKSLCRFRRKMEHLIEDATPDDEDLKKSFRSHCRNLDMPEHPFEMFIELAHAIEAPERGRPYDEDDRMFTEQVHMGNGFYTLTEALHVHRRLEDALTTLGGIQQSPMSTDQYPAGQWDREVEEGQRRIEFLVRDIAAALTGKEIQFVEKA